MSSSSLPLILVSAKTEAAALDVISEIVDKSPAETGGEGCVWRIVTKYYSADVRLLPLADGAPPPDAPPEGHLIYLHHDEVESAVGELRYSRVGGARVRVLCAAVARLPAELRGWCARRRLEPVALRAGRPHSDSEEEGEEGEGPRGVQHARAALAAHVWPGLRRVHRAHTPPHDVSVSSEGEECEEEEEWGEWSGGGGGEVEAAQQWAAVLGMVGAVRALPRDQRLPAAERLVCAVARALDRPSPPHSPSPPPHTS